MSAAAGLLAADHTAAWPLSSLTGRMLVKDSECARLGQYRVHAAGLSEEKAQEAWWIMQQRLADSVEQMKTARGKPAVHAVLFSPGLGLEV